MFAAHVGASGGDIWTTVKGKARIIEVARTGISILMVEQNARQALEIADKGYVLVQGANAYTDTGAALLADPEVRRTFLGG